MVSLIRKYQQSAMIVVTFLIIIAFVAYWNGPTGSRNRMPTASDDFGKIYGNTVTLTTLRREVEKAKLASQLKLDLFRGLVGGARTPDEMVNNFAWNSLVLQHEADLLQIEPVGEAVHSDEGVADAIKKLFQTPDGQFDPAAYAGFVSNELASHGFNAGDLEELIAEDLRMKKIKALLQSTFVLSPSDFRELYAQEYQKVDLSVVKLNPADFVAKIQVSDDDIKKAFEQNIDGYKSEEKRGVKFVTFGLTDEEKKLKGKDRVPALQRLSNSVQDFMQALQEKGAKFDDVAAKFNVPVTNVPPFEASEPDPKVPQGLVEALFKLTKENPTSDAISDEETGAYYVAQLQEIVPSRQLTLAEARPQIMEQLKNSRAQEELASKGASARTGIAAAVTAGKSFADAAKAEGETVETYPPLSISDGQTATEDQRYALYIAKEMKDGEVSSFVPIPSGGGLIVHVDKREPIDPKDFETTRAMIEPTLEQEQVDIVFDEWLRKQHAAADIVAGATGAKATPVPPPQ